ncbi:MFS transporter [Streptomyces sp. NPDC049954]|uniref:MFS transporter n=1 Tax=Streptomyces sp. NPDC049954 TaxID=3155779 RepID=UPI003441C8F5
MTAGVTGGQAVGSRGSWLPLLASTTASVVAMDSLAVPIALDPWGTGPQMSLSLLEWTVIAYSLAFAALLPAACALHTRYGSRRMLCAGQVLLAAASVGCALAPVGAWLALGRAGQGAAAALVTPAVLRLAGQLSSPRTRGLVLPGCAGGGIELSAAGGPLVCALVAQGGDWRWIFWLNVPVCLLSLVLAAGWRPDRHDVPGRPDLESALVTALGCFALAWGVTEGTRRGWDSAAVLLGLGLGTVLLLVLLAGRIPLGGFRAREFLAVRVGYACGCAALYCTVLLLQRYFLATDPVGRPLYAWLHLAPLCLGLLVCAPLSDPLALRLGTSRLMALALVTSALSLGALAWGAHRGSPYTVLLLPLLLSGAGIALAVPTGRTLALVVPAKSLPGAGLPAVGALRNLGGSFGAASVGVLPAFHASGSGARSLDGLAPAIGMAGLICLAGAATYFAVPSRRSPLR